MSTSSRLPVVAAGVFVVEVLGCRPRPPDIPSMPPEPPVAMPFQLGSAEAPATGGPRRGEPDVDPVVLPADPAALPSPVVRWTRTWPGRRWRGPLPESFLPDRRLLVLWDEWQGKLLGLDVDTGQDRWTVPLGAEERASSTMLPVNHEGVAFLPAGRALVAVDLVAGAVLWRTQVAGEPEGAAYVADGRLLVRTTARPLEAPDDPNSLPDFGAAADVRLVALDEVSGALAWEVGLEDPHAASQLAVGAHLAVVARYLAPEDGAGDHAWPGPAGDQGQVLGVASGEPVWQTDVRLYRLVDGVASGSTVVPGRGGQPLVAGDVLVLPVGVDTVNYWSGRPTSRSGEPLREGGMPRLVGLRLPSLEPAWEVPLVERPEQIRTLAPDVEELVEEPEIRLFGQDIVVFMGGLVHRVDATTGAVRVEENLGPLLATGGRCELDGPVLAGNSILVGNYAECPRRQLVLLDRVTLRPWRVVAAPHDLGWGLLADDRTAVVALEDGVMVIDLATAGPPERDTTSAGQLIAESARDIEEDGYVSYGRLERRAAEIALAGDAVGLAVIRALETGSTAERIVAAAVLEQRPGAAAVPAMIAAVPPPEPPVADSPRNSCDRGSNESGRQAELRGTLRYLLLERLATCGDPRAGEFLGTVFRGHGGWSGAARSLAMQGLVAIGTREALRVVDAWREERSRRDEPWSPPAATGRPGRRYDWAGQMMAGQTGPDTGTSDPTHAESADGSVRAFVAYAAGGASDVWLQSETSGATAPLFTAVTSPYGIGIVSVAPTSGGATVVVRRTVPPECQGPVPAEGEEAVPAPPAEETITLRWADLRRDSDRDGWSDLLERRLRTDPAKADTDGDGTTDPRDVAPLGTGPVPADSCTRETALTAAFFAMFAFSTEAVPLFVEGPGDMNLQYEGYPGPVVYLGQEEANALQTEVGLDGATYFFFHQESTAQPDGTWQAVGSPMDDVVLSSDGTEATVEVGEYRGNLNSVGHRIVLRCLDNRWYPLSIEQTWVT